MAFHTKVKLILKWPFGVYQETNEKFLRISALALKFLHTSYNSFFKWTKISSLEITIFEFENDGKKWSRIYSEIDRAPSEIPAKLPGQFGHSG